MKKEKGITLIALVITIIVLLILAAVGIAMLTGENGILSKAMSTREATNEANAREKLELVLADLKADKYSDNNYNKDEYVNDRLYKNDMDVNGDIVSVDGWRFEIDRETLQIVNSLGKGNENQDIKIESSVNYNETLSEATITYTISYNGDIKTIVANGENKEVPQKTDGKYVVEIKVSNNGTYRIRVTDSNDNYKTGSAIVEGLASDLEIKNAEELKAFSDKVNSGMTFEGKTIKLMNDIDLKLSNVCGEGIGNWVPIGDCASNNKLYFGGTFDGNNHTINNLYINDSSKGYQGLFGNVKNGEIRNLNVNGSVTGKEYCGRNSRRNSWSTKMYNRQLSFKCDSNNDFK